jgi:hypothetical protein
MDMRIRLHPLFNEDGAIGAESGVDTAPAAEVQTNGTSADQQGVDTQAAAEPEKQNNFEKAFAKRLAAEREKWQNEVSEKYKDYDTHKELSDYFQKINGMDAMTLKERVEMERLQERAEKENVSPEVLKRLDELEAKAAKADEYEKQQQQNQTLQEFENGLKEFAKDKQLEGKPVDHMELWKYMHENGISKPEAAFKAMKADLLEKQLETAKKDAVDEYLNSKKGVKVEGSAGTAGVTTVDTSKMSWKDLNKHAAARLEASKQPQ